MPPAPTIMLRGLSAMLLLAGCTAPPAAPMAPPPAGSATSREAAVRWTVAADLVDCVGVAPMRCLRYRDAPDGPWKLHYGSIEGFEFVRGVEIDLLVRVVPVPDPPADAPSRRVVLVEELERRAVALPPEFPPMLAETAWELVSMPGAASVVGPRGPLSIRFERSGRVSGNAGVNRFGASAQVDGDRLRVDRPLVTRMAGPPEAMALEGDFLGRLGRVASWHVADERLRLLDGQGRELMTLRRMAPDARP